MNTRDIPGVEILDVGIWNGREYTLADLDALVDSFCSLKDIYSPPAKLGHNPEQRLLASDGLPAAGWVSNLYRRGEKLVADFSKVPAKVADLIQAGGYRTRSSEIWFNAEFDGTTYPAVLKAVSWLGEDAPAVSGLDDIVKLYTKAPDREPELHSVELSQVEVAELAARHEPITGSHSHPHPAYGSQGGDHFHDHPHMHNGDASHRHHSAGLAKSNDTPAISTAPWNAAAEVKQADPSDLRKMCAVVTGDGSVKADFKLPHHEAGGDFPVNKAGVIASAAALQGARGGLTGVSPADIKKAKSHIAAHYRELGLGAPPWAKSEAKHSLEDFAALALDEPSFDEIRNRVRDALQARYPFVAMDGGYTASVTNNDGPSPSIEDLYPDCVIVWDQDYDELWQVPFTLGPDGKATLGLPVPVRCQYEPIPQGASMSRAPVPQTATQPIESPASGRRQETETMTDAEIRAILGLAETDEIKPALLALKAQHVELSDHQALVREVAELKQHEVERAATALIDRALSEGKLSPAMVEWARSYCLADLKGFETYIASAAKVIEFGARGSETDNQDAPAAPSTTTLSIAKQFGLSAGDLTKIDPRPIIERKRALAKAHA